MTTLHLTFYLDMFYASHEGLYICHIFFTCTPLCAFDIIKNSFTRFNRTFDCIFSDFLFGKFSKRRKRKGEPKLAVIASVLAPVSCFLPNNILIVPCLGGHGISYWGHCFMYFHTSGLMISKHIVSKYDPHLYIFYFVLLTTFLGRYNLYILL